MKIVRLIIKIFNCVIMAVAAVATIFLFASPSLSFNSRIDVNVEKLSALIPENDYSKDINVVESLGTDTISVSLKFKIYAGDITKTMKDDRERINKVLIDDNVQDIASELHEPVKLITEHGVRTVVRRISEDQMKSYVDSSREKYEEEHPSDPKTTTEAIMDMVGLNDRYFDRFTNTLYETANADDANLTAVSNVLFNAIDDILVKAKNMGAKVDNTSFTEEKRDEVKGKISDVFGQLSLIKDEEGHLEKISEVAFVYLNNFIKKDLKKGGTLDPKYEQKTGEQLEDYTDRLLGEFVREKLPDVFYKVVGGVSIGLFIGLFIFTLTWVGLILITAYRTFLSKKKGPWTFFGPWFWLVGILQVVLGFVLTYVGKVVLPSKFDIGSLNLPISNVLVAPRTYCLVPSILFFVCIGLGVVYLVLKILFKKKIKEDNEKVKEA